jgi:hypothetical protein
MLFVDSIYDHRHRLQKFGRILKNVDRDLSQGAPQVEQRPAAAHDAVLQLPKAHANVGTSNRRMCLGTALGH